MRKFSRHMPPLQIASMTTEGCFPWYVVGMVAAGALLSPYPLAVPWFIVVVITFAAWQVVVRTDAAERRTRIAAERRGESICTFARSFPRRSVDPWVVRAVYEELHRAVGSSFAPRSTDPLGSDLEICEDEDVEDLIVAVADRVGRSLDAPEGNPYYARIETVGDVVRILSAQPPSPAGLALRPCLRGTA